MLDQPAPQLELPATGNQTFRLADARGRTVVLYFYPKDNTPGCTTEGQQFRDLYSEFQKYGCDVYGISRDHNDRAREVDVRLKKLCKIMGLFGGHDAFRDYGSLH